MADVTLPQLGETVTEGTITQWFKQVGDTVAADEPLFEVSTDKVDTEVPSPVAGTVLEIRAAEGDTVAVGSVIAVVGDGAETAAPPAEAPAPAVEPAPSPQPAPAPTPPAPPAPAAAEQPSAPAPPVAEQPPAPAPPATAPVEQAPEPPPAAPVPATAAVAEEPATEPAAPAAEPAPTAGDARLLSPVVRRLVNEHGIDPSQIQGTGPGGRITREDVLDHIDRNGAAAAAPAQQAPQPPPAPQAAPEQAAPPPAPTTEPAAREAPATSGTRREEEAQRTTSPPSSTEAKRTTSPPSSAVKLTKIRKLTGDHMVMSKATSPHAFSVVEVDYANVDATRSRVKEDWKAHEGFSLTYLPFISRAIIDAIAEFPHMNASVGADELTVHDYVDLGIAVDLQYEGLLAPVVRNAETKRLRAIAREISDLAARAKSRKLSPDEIQGGTFTITNNGSAGSVLTMPIINQPQVAIISTDAIVRKAVVVTLPDGGEAIVVHPVGNLAMAWDHRAFDGAYAANFLARIKVVLETRDWDAEL